MKFLITVTILFISIAFAQAQDSAVKKIANVPVLKNAQQVSVSEFNNYAKKRFKTHTKPTTRGESFIVGNLLISIHQEELKHTLEKLKTSEEAMSKDLGTSLDVSKFMYFNNKRYYILEDHLQDESTVWFFSEPHERKTFSGFIKFKTPNRDEAYKYLNELLSNVEFKK